MSRLTTRHGLRAAMAGAALLCLGVAAASAAIPATLAVQGALGPDHRDTGGGNDSIVNLRATIRTGALANLYQEDHCGVVTVGRDGEFGILLGETLPVVLPFDEQYHVLIDACYDRHGCDGITNVDECDPDDRVTAIVMLDPVAYAHRAREADAISGSFMLNGDVAGPYFNLQLQPAVVGTPELADGSVTIPKLGFDPATQLELDAEAAARTAADAAEAAARTAADAAEAAARAAADTAEATARTAADATLQSNINAEAATRAAADATLQSNINAEAAARAAADTAETNARTAADATLQSNINAEAAARAAADTSEAAARVAGDTHAGDVTGPNTNLQIQAGAVGSPEIADASILLQDLAPNGAANRDYIRWNGSAWVKTPVGDIGNRSTSVGAANLPNSTGCCNTAVGLMSQQAMITGFQNTSLGDASLNSNTDGVRNVAIGAGSLDSATTGSNNIGVGAFTLRNATGDGNIAIGTGSGGGLTSGSNNIYVDAGAAGASESDTIRIGSSQTEAYLAGVRGSTINGWTVVVRADGRLGTSGTPPASDDHSGDVSGPSDDLQIQLGTVGTDEVANNSLTANDLATGSVGSAEVDNNSLTEDDLANGSVGSAEVANNSLTASDLATDSVGSDEVDNNSLTASDLGANSVGSSEVIASEVQLRVTGNCPPGQSIRSIDADGSVTCEAPAGTGFARFHFYDEVGPLELYSVTWTCDGMCLSGGMRMTDNVVAETVHFVNSGGYYTSGSPGVPPFIPPTAAGEKWFSTIYNGSLANGRWVDFSVVEQD